MYTNISKGIRPCLKARALLIRGTDDAHDEVDCPRIIIAIFAVVKLGLRPLHEELLKNTMEGSHFHANCLDFKYLSKRVTTRPQHRFIKAFEKESYGQASDQQLYLSPTYISFSLSVR
jgi:hypothetical protein